MSKNKGVHAAHCCVLHGCKYADKSCPVTSGLVKQYSPCEDCSVSENPQTLEQQARLLFSQAGGSVGGFDNPCDDQEAVIRSTCYAIARHNLS